MLTALAVTSEASRISTSYATSTWSPSRFGKRRTASSKMFRNVPVADDVDESMESIETIDELIIESQHNVEVHENERIAPASAKAALIAVVSATVIGGARHAMELVL